MTGTSYDGDGRQNEEIRRLRTFLDSYGRPPQGRMGDLRR
eukprot:CAMPEP_0184288022 /NCGR_PEP_ID=MMETSP1049-20130417/483_1 /TAXON_ID=77928 /ORGANISM="Proteomonas sulcata, Strain CCMP704" /LENGTH=39 /DNA_ID= /DNA_START= /DNA_END= /DNA_ORIENTATION=